MNLVDIIILFVIALGGLIGLKRGVIKEIVVFGGLILAYVLAFIFKNNLSTFMYHKLPFFSFNGIFKGVSVLNIILYELLAFFIILSLILIVLKVLKFVSSIIEKILTFTIVLGIPSKILGAIIGIFEYYLIVFVILFILSFPTFNLPIMKSSILADKILYKTVFLSDLNAPLNSSIEEIFSIRDKYKNSEDFNIEALKILLKYKIVDTKSIDYLIESGKLNIEDINLIYSQLEEE